MAMLRHHAIFAAATFALLFPSSFAHAQSGADPFASLVAAERDFAADAQRIGITGAFRAHAASDSVLLTPEPVAAPERLAKQRDTPGLTLEWHPSVAGIARSHDLGFTTGPYRMVDGGRVLAGQFLTIWSRGADGRWRWFLDHGLPPQAAEGAASLPTQVIRLADAAQAKPEGEVGQSLELAEQALNAGYLEKGVAALLPVLAEDGYLLRTHVGSIAKPDAARLAPDTRRFARAEQLGTRISGAGDLAASYGRLVPATGAPAYYVRVWRRDGVTWQLLIDELV
ncbi:nuclear transport factor 2 family protein [Sphingomonas sp. R-74633]|uniref:nuclear transport factor 2 family protein n=1 Tax=Sphingomonas sp. R-74633 TaxID=2751188 RepID=UPI0015D115C4|nr:nuclear transport factor 2 family protein [Sphingomonas sp. R-74633]NYT41972.1 nuclear transport factor 2 family protein [Sphingomonas sp. R-74633]